MSFTQKTITIRVVHDNWIKENCINLSRYVQRQLDTELMGVSAVNEHT